MGWFAWGRERLASVYSLPDPLADSARDVENGERERVRERQEE